MLGDMIMGTVVDALGTLPTSLQHSFCTVNTAIPPQDSFFWLGSLYGLCVGQEEAMYMHTHAQ